jgi:hypothetical protein
MFRWAGSSRWLPFLALFLAAPAAFGFCGFYVAKADTKLFNRASQVALVRDGDRTVITMANDFEGDLKEFAVVIPVPTFLKKEQIHIGDKALVDHLDAYSSPRLVEYFDPDPCGQVSGRNELKVSAQAPMLDRDVGRAESLGVTIEARYTVGEYDILILSAEQSSGLETWLRENGYRIPDGAGPILGSYLKQGAHFFVAKVNLKEQSRLGFSYLRPIQVAFESPKFMLPIRLGTVNANGPQELFIYALTRKGRVETTNYRTVKLPSDMDVPLFVKDEFAGFYRALFSEQVKKEHMHSVFLEYAWDMNWCDPCAAQPLSRDELRKLGVFWITSNANGSGGPQDVFLTRLHLRYDAAHFPEDLVFQETADRTNFQARYVLRHAFAGQISCASDSYREELAARHEQEAKNLVSLTGWRIADVRQKMNLVSENIDDRKWYERIWEK